jgi:hypothetical protein
MTDTNEEKIMEWLDWYSSADVDEVRALEKLLVEMFNHARADERNKVIEEIEKSLILCRTCGCRNKLSTKLNQLKGR